MKEQSGPKKESGIGFITGREKSNADSSFLNMGFTADGSLPSK